MTTEDYAGVLEALESIEAAQNAVEEAAQALCPVPGFAREWMHLTRLFSRVKAEWHRIEKHRAALARRAGTETPGTEDAA